MVSYCAFRIDSGAYFLRRDRIREAVCRNDLYVFCIHCRLGHQSQGRTQRKSSHASPVFESWPCLRNSLQYRISVVALIVQLTASSIRLPSAITLRHGCDARLKLRKWKDNAMDALADDGETLKFFGASSRCGDAGAQSQTFATNHRWS